jgi:hypothetical protein
VNVFQDQIDRLTANPRQIPGEWLSGIGLFECRNINGSFGCLTQIKTQSSLFRKRAKGVAGLTDIIERIFADERIPTSSYDITPESLPAFAEYQEEFNRIPSCKGW